MSEIPSSSLQTEPSERAANLLRAIGQAERIKILLVIGYGEACVCHLEAALGWRQAYISQHLMALREAGIVISRREGRYIYYRLEDTRMVELIQQAGTLSGIPEIEINLPEFPSQLPNCPCLHCAAPEGSGCSQSISLMEEFIHE